MSTRAIITVRSADGKDVRRLYAHGDGYPSEVGRLVDDFAKLAPRIDGNAGGPVRTAAFGSWSPGKPHKEGRYRQFSNLGKAYSGMYNVSIEPDKFVPGLIAFMTSKGYAGLYLTDRDPDKEAAAAGHGGYGTDIEWHYVVTLGKDFGVAPRVEVYASEYYGPPKPLYTDERGKVVTIGRLQHFVKRGPTMSALVAEEQAERLRYRKEVRAEKAAEKKTTYSVSSAKPKTKRRTTRSTSLGGMR